jgi:ubiquinone/menaquinone biosynthesis C-methylase UbiE
MAEASHYVIRGGVEGRERLRVMSRVLHPTTSALLDRLGIDEGWSCLDVGCGGGDVTLELARRVGARGCVLGVDIDRTKLELARSEAAQQSVGNVTFEEVDIRSSPTSQAFDLVYSRFLLTHLSDPGAAVSAFHRHLRRGGVVAVEDIDFSGYVSYPPSPALERYRELYCATVIKRGGDPNIGPRLPSLLSANGFQDVDVNIVQPAGLQGEVKLINPLTMENIIGPVLEDGLATRDEIDGIVHELHEFAVNPTTLSSVPRIVQAWGRRRV